MQKTTRRTKERLRDTDGQTKNTARNKRTIIYIKKLTEDQLLRQGRGNINGRLYSVDVETNKRAPSKQTTDMQGASSEE